MCLATSRELLYQYKEAGSCCWQITNVLGGVEVAVGVGSGVVVAGAKVSVAVATALPPSLVGSVVSAGRQAVNQSAKLLINIIDTHNFFLGINSPHKGVD